MFLYVLYVLLCEYQVASSGHEDDHDVNSSEYNLIFISEPKDLGLVSKTQEKTGKEKKQEKREREKERKGIEISKPRVR